MLKKLNGILNILISSLIGAFVGYDIYVYLDYRTHPGLYDMQSEKMKIDPSEIRYIFLTHAHDDHAGYLNEILSECPDARIVMSDKALERLCRGQNSFCGGCTTRIALFFCTLMKLVGKGRHLFPPIKQEYQCRCIQVTGQKVWNC